MESRRLSPRWWRWKEIDGGNGYAVSGRMAEKAIVPRYTAHPIAGVSDDHKWRCGRATSSPAVPFVIETSFEEGLAFVVIRLF